jgi:hypothetical protein
MFFAVFRRPKDPARHMGAGPKAKIRLGLEILEDRTLLSTVTWINASSGDWDTAANWRDDMGNNRLPGAADDVVLPSGSYTVTHGSAVTDAVASITNQAAIVLSGGTLNVSGNVGGTGSFTLSGGTLGNATVTAGTTITGTPTGGVVAAITLNGVLDLSSGTDDDNTVVVRSGMTLNGTVRLGNSQGGTTGILEANGSVVGTGEIVLGGSDYNRVNGSIIGPHITIHGASGILSGIDDQGTIVADVPNGTIVVNNLFNHNCTLGASSANAVLEIIGTVTNTNSTLTLSGPGQIFVNNSTINGGTITSLGGGTLWASSARLIGVNLLNVDLDGTAYAQFHVVGGITVTGTVHVNGTLTFDNTGTIDGTGTIVFSSNRNNGLRVSTNGVVATLGPTLTIRGMYVAVGDGFLQGSMINEATIGPDAGGRFEVFQITNENGTFSAASGGYLDIGGYLNNAGSTLTLSGPGGIDLWGGTISGGIIVSANGGKLSGSDQWGTLNGVTLNADLDVGTIGNGHSNPVVVLGSTLTLNGTLSLGSSDGAVSGALSVNYVRIDGTGTILFGGSDANHIGPGGMTLGAGLQIHGQAGSIASIFNEGTIAADVAGGTISLSAFTNDGTVEAVNGGTLSINNTDNFSDGTLTGGAWKVFDDSTLKVGLFFGPALQTDAAIIVLDGPNSHFYDQSSHDALANLTTISASGSLTIENGRNWIAARNFTNHGSLAIGSASTVTVPGSYTDNGSLAVLASGTFDLAGGGTISGSAQLDGTLNVQLEATLEMAASAGGSGNLNVAGSLVIDSGAIVNLAGTYSQSGNLTVRDGGSLDLTGSFTNFASNTLTAGSYDILGTLQFTGANIVTNGAQITLDGPDAQIVDEYSNDAFADFATNLPGASFTLQNGSAEFPTGDVANAGTLVIGPGSIFAPAGTYLQTAGITILNGGTLGSGVLVDLEGGILSGSGTIAASVQNAAEIDIGSIDAAGLLTITGNYTQISAGVLSLKIGGYNPGTDFDQLSVYGTATLDGTVNISLFNGFVPTLGDGFQVLTFGAVTGDFATYNGLDLGGGLSLAPVYDSNSLTLVTTSGPASSTQIHGLRELAILDGALAEALGRRMDFQAVRPMGTE